MIRSACYIRLWIERTKKVLAICVCRKQFISCVVLQRNPDFWHTYYMRHDPRVRRSSALLDPPFNERETKTASQLALSLSLFFFSLSLATQCPSDLFLVISYSLFTFHFILYFYRRAFLVYAFFHAVRHIFCSFLCRYVWLIQINTIRTAFFLLLNILYGYVLSSESLPTVNLFF